MKGLAFVVLIVVASGCTENVYISTTRAREGFTTAITANPQEPC